MTDYLHDPHTIEGVLERHVLEDPEYHEKTDPETGMGTGELDDPHCDWCWEPWPCVTSELAFRLQQLER